MSSSSSYHPLHRGKRPFDEYDSDPSHPQPMPTNTSNPRFTPESRHKRPRSTSSSSTDDSSSNPSSSSYTTAQSSSRTDFFSSTNPLDCPVASPSPFVPTQDVHMSDFHLPVPPQRTHIPSPPTPEDSLRTSLQRFAEFDRQIAALRTSLAASRSPPPPTMDDDPPHWRSNTASFFSSQPTATDPASSNVAVAPSQTLNSLSTFPSSDDVANIAAPSPTASAAVPSLSFQPTFSNSLHHTPCPSYLPSVGGPSLQRVGDASSSTTPAFMRPPSDETTMRTATRSSFALDSSAPPSHIRQVRRTLSPLVLPPDPPSSSPSSDDVLLRYRTLLGDVDGRSRRQATDSHVTTLDREVASHLENYLGEQPRLPQGRLGDRVRVIREHSVDRESIPSVFDVFNIGESSHQERNRPAPPVSRYTSILEPVQPRVPGTHNERPRGPAPITTTANTSQVSSQDIHPRVHSSWASIPSSNSLMSESASERRHALALERFRAQLRRPSFDADDESDSRWSASSRGERERESGDLGIASPVPPSPSVDSVPGTGTSSHFPPLGGVTRAPGSAANRTEPSTSLQRSFSELFAETQRIEEGTEAWLLDWDPSRVTERERVRDRERERERQLERERERQRERVWEWERERERQRERLGQDVRGRSLASGSSLASTSARDGSSYPPSVLPRPSPTQLVAGPSTTAQNATSTMTTAPANNNNQQYSYNNLNLSSFQSGLFRDSLRRNVEVDQAPLSTSGAAIPPVPPGDSRAASRLGLDDSESDMDLDDFVRTRPPSPEWSRPHPYAGRTPPPDYSPPPRNFNLRPSFSVRRGRVVSVNYESPGRVQQPNRNSTVLTRPIPPTSSGPTRPPSYETNNQPSPSERTDRDRFHPSRLLLESFYRLHDDGRRNTATGTGLPYQPNQNHAAVTSGSSAVSRYERNDVPSAPRGTGNGARPGPEVAAGENRRSSLSLGGSIRSRLARLANPQSVASSNGTEVLSGSGQRSPPRPMGARPQVAEQRRRGSLVSGGANVLEHASRLRNASGPLPWAMNSSGTADPSSGVTRDVPWRAPSGARNVFAAPPPTSSSGRPEMPEVVGRSEEQRSRLRTLRQRLQLDRGNDGVRFRHGMFRSGMGRRGNLGDYVPDELFDDSYEALLSLSNMLGEVRSKATPEDVIASLPTGTFKEWKRDNSETRCPICLDDYEPSDVLTKLIECTHWLHKNCLEQWLRTANTCPVCREKVKTSPKQAPARRRPHRDIPETNPGTSNSATSGNGPSSRPAHATAQANNGRPASFAAMVFDRLMSGDGTAEPLTPPPFVVPPATRDARRLYADRVRAQQQQYAREPHQPAHTHDHRDVFIEFASPHELPYHLRVPPTGQPGPSSYRPTAGAGTDGPIARPFSFALRGQGSDSSMSTSSGASMVVDDVGPANRHSMAVGTNGGPGPLFFDTPSTVPRRDNPFGFVPSSSSTFGGTSSTSVPAPIAPPATPLHYSHPPHPPSMSVDVPTMASAPREWRGPRSGGYDALFHMDASRSSSSSSVSGAQRPMSVASRLPVEEDSPFEEFVFGWRARGGRLGTSSGP